MARSLGGNGGNGGNDFQATTSQPGPGGAGGHGGAVSVRSPLDLRSTASDSAAITAQSIGGSAGLTGSGTGWAHAYQTNSRNGGNAGTVDVRSTGTLTVQDERSYGIAATSSGGSGGLSGFTFGGFVSLGGQGGRGGDGGYTFVENKGAINVGPKGAGGILAESLGGAGGWGTDTSSGIYSRGGPGGNSGTGGWVTVENYGAITTQSTGGRAILAQSIGGAGGAAGDSSGIAALGGLGGFGGRAGDARVASNGVLTTGGAAADGVAVQSIGGGGGAGGSATGVGFLASVAVGGQGGTGGVAGNAASTNWGSIYTSGLNSRGMLAESIGGGGGIGGNGEATAIGVVFSVGVGIGGKGGSGNTAGAATLENNDLIQTRNDNSAGMEALSIGGGGGIGGRGVAESLTFGVIPKVPINIAVSASVGGAGGTGGDAGAAKVTNAATVRTAGAGSSGLAAMSIGGGGGDGSDATASATVLALTPSVALPISVAVGGSGGAAGNGRTATVGNTGSVLTSGNESRGLMAMSVGGGGGMGGAGDATGDSVSLKGPELKLSVGVGGQGTGGGAGGTVNASNSGLIVTKGSDAVGLAAYSIGGGGGAAGGGYTDGSAGNVKIDVGVGGKGGVGGNGGTVNVSTSTAGGDSQILTTGAGSHGIHAQSVGGGGGVGGGSGKSEVEGGPVSLLTEGVKAVKTIQEIKEAKKEEESKSASQIASEIKKTEPEPGLGTKTMNVLKEIKGSVDVKVGGQGGAAGSGGYVAVSNAQPVETRGEKATGIFAQSIGGGGGNGGGGATNGGNALAVTATVGGGGGASGWGGTVSVNNQSRVTTSGLEASAILAQSVGGGGGNGGAAVGKSEDTKFTIGGGTGGAGGAAGGGGAVAVEVGNVQVTTKGSLSHGVLAQSIGGGGGNGALATSQDETSIGGMIEKIADASEKNGNINLLTGSVRVNVGGGGGSAGPGGPVSVTHHGVIVTSGPQSNAILAQSIGGGGGTGASVAPDNSVNILAFALGLGGAGGAAGDGGTVAVTNNQWLKTSGIGAHGVLAQSVGGGGGIGDSAGEAVSASWFSLGGRGVGGSGNAVTVTNLGSVQTQGRGAHGIVAQSIGGGGGAAEASGGSGTALITLRGSAGSDGSATTGSGGTVKVVAGTVDTRGDSAAGVIAQSIGGGGGIAGTTATPAMLVRNGQSTVRLATGQAIGSGGPVSVTYENKTITTTGAGSIGILAQSVGGGGGIGGSLDGTLGSDTVAAGSFANPAGGSFGSEVSVKGAGRIETSGRNAHGILAQSIGGGGGLVQDRGRLVLRSEAGSVNSGGPITIAHAGDLIATGENSSAVVAANSGNSRGAVNIRLDAYPDGKPAQVTGGATGTGAAVQIFGGSNTASPNEITVGQGVTMSAGTGVALRLNDATGSTEVAVYGTMNGDVRFGSGSLMPGAATPLARTGQPTVNLSVKTGSRFQTDSETHLGAAGRLTVQTGGTLATPDRASGSTRLWGNLELAGTWEPGLALDRSGDAAAIPTLVVEGQALTAGGRIAPTVTRLGKPAQPFALLQATGTMTVGEIVDSLAVDYQKDARTSDKQLWINVNSVNFAPSTVALSGRAKAVAEAINNAYQANWTSGELAALNADSTAVKVLGKLMSERSAAAYGSQMADLGESFGVTSATTNLAPVSGFLNRAQSCPTYVGTTAALREESCLWSRVVTGYSHTFSSENGNGSKGNSSTVQIGGQQLLNPDWLVGLSAAYTDGIERGKGGTFKAASETYTIGAVLKYQPGHWLFSAGLAYAHDLTRTQTMEDGFGIPLLITSKPTTDYLMGRLRASYLFDFQSWYLRPRTDLDITRIARGAFSQRGADDLNMQFRAFDEVQASVTPTLEVGGRLAVGDITLRPYASAGLTVNARTQWENQFNFQFDRSGTPASFTTTTPRLGFNGTLGLDAKVSDAIDIKLEYNSTRTENSQSHEASLKAAYRF
jgi:hypothetical protein